MPKVYIFFFATPFKTGKAIRFLTHRRYNHVAISLTPEGRTLYSFARYRYSEPLLSGFVEENPGRYACAPQNVGLCVCELEVSPAHYARICQHIADYQQAQSRTCYNFADLLVYPFHRHLQLAYTHTCISFLLELLEIGDLHTIGQLETALTDRVIYTGPLSGYCDIHAEEAGEFFERRSRRVVYWQSGKMLCHHAGQVAGLGLRHLWALCRHAVIV